MPIVLRLDRVMADRKISLQELAEEVGISNVNLSNIKTGKVRAIRFSTLESVVDASFLITCPDFRINDIDAAKWTIGGENLPNDVKSHVYFGDKKMYKTYDLIGRVSSSMFLFLVSKTM